MLFGDEQTTHAHFVLCLHLFFVERTSLQDVAIPLPSVSFQPPAVTVPFAIGWCPTISSVTGIWCPPLRVSYAVTAISQPNRHFLAFNFRGTECCRAWCNRGRQYLLV